MQPMHLLWILIALAVLTSIRHQMSYERRRARADARFYLMISNQFGQLADALDPTVERPPRRPYPWRAVLITAFVVNGQLFYARCVWQSRC
jgi:hypothetical protein